MDEIVQATDGKSNGESSKSKRARPVKMVAVQVIHQEGAAALVQWAERDDLQRGIVPAESVVDGGEVAADELAACIPYGEDWSVVAGVTPGVVKTLKENGIWTKADALASPRRIREALIIGYVPATLESIMQYAKEE